MKKMTLNRDQLKIIAICAMVIDHIAWGFLEFHTPVAQVMHVIGRMTIPIMCFFVAEGYRYTSDVKKYVRRLVLFGLISLFPYYFYFRAETGYRLNIMFDLLFGLLMICAIESHIKKWEKVVCVIMLFAISAIIGGWPMTPSMFILAFYYGRDFKEKAKWVIIADLLTVVFQMGGLYINESVHLMDYDGFWWDRAYLLGFILALIPLSRYNGEKGKNIGGRYFFYFFYPAHFVILLAFRYFYGLPI